ncbi:MAG: thrombospondin type-1 domain-containing protein, partial [Myxococcota bacterium]
PSPVESCTETVGCGWRFVGEWSACSIGCGTGGVQTRTVECFDPVDGESLEIDACGDNDFTLEGTRNGTVATRDCPSDDYTACAVVNDPDPCSSACTNIQGSQDLNPTCVDNRSGANVPLANCVTAGLSAPTSGPCFGTQQPGVYQSNPDANCSAVCGTGTKPRTCSNATCGCTGNPTESCTTACDFVGDGDWTPTLADQCISTQVTQTQTVRCENNEGRVLSDSVCGTAQDKIDAATRQQPGLVTGNWICLCPCTDGSFCDAVCDFEGGCGCDESQRPPIGPCESPGDPDEPFCDFPQP